MPLINSASGRATLNAQRGRLGGVTLPALFYLQARGNEITASLSSSESRPPREPLTAVDLAPRRRVPFECWAQSLDLWRAENFPCLAMRLCLLR